MQLRRRYRFVRTLGRGATGTVQLVEDLANPGTPIALKRLTAATDAMLRAAFEREFTVLAALSMPGVARVIDFGVATPDPDHDEPGGPFMTRAYVEGAPLDEAARDREVRDCAVLVGRLCRIVAPLHRAGIVHGDIKPSNVIVTPDGMPVLIDFGLASLPGQRVRGAGTPGFMAPEVAAGGPATTASDVYALGATLWFLLTGAPPRTEHPTTHKGLVASNEPVTRALLDVAQRALAPEPSHRLPSVLELEAALAAVVPLPTAPFAFVPPRPRGHEAPLAEAERVIAAQLAGSGRPQQIVLLAGAPGSGRSTLLRELRWRAQLRGTTTLAIGLSGATAPELLRALARAASFHGPADGLAPEPSVDRVVELLLALVARGPTLLLVDDLDRAEPAALDALRDVVHAGGLERLAVVATWDPAVSTAALQPTESVSIPPLTREQLESACRDVLGVVDAAVVEALWRRSGGLPGPAADMLAALYEVGAPTADDVESLPTATARRRGALAELASLPSTAADGLVALAIAGGRLPRALLGDVLGLQPRLADALVASGLVRAGPGDEILELVDRELGCVLRETSEPDALARLARALLAAAEARADAVVAAHAAAQLGDTAALERHAAAAAQRLEQEGARREALALWEAVAGSDRDGPLRAQAALESARLRLLAGEHDRARTWSERVLASPHATDAHRIEATLLRARTLAAAGRLDDALDALRSVETPDPVLHARLLAERARVQLRRGRYDAVETEVTAGLALAPPHDAVRIELLTSGAAAASYTGRRTVARARAEEAIALARTLGSPRDEAQALAYLAIDHQRAGELERARELYARCLQAAQQLGDRAWMASHANNLGGVLQQLGEPTAAAEHYELAIQWARRSGRWATAIGARANLAGLLIQLGAYERARAHAEEARAEALRAGLQLVAAQATGLLGELAARTGDVELAVQRLDEAAARYRELGQPRELCEALLDCAEVLLDRGGMAETSAAASRLHEARGLVQRHALTDLELALRLQLARARAATGDTEGAVTELERVVQQAREARRHDLLWRALAALGEAHDRRGAELLARRADEEAMETLEALAIRLPRDERETFWRDPRRQALRRRTSRAGGGATRPTEAASMHGAPAHPPIEQRMRRLLEVLKRLASERDLDRLLERITDAAVELSGAERGFVLLVGPDGRLEPRTVRAAAGSEARAAFSRSIAEAVLIDGEPIVTVDARADRRVSEFLSVHDLMLQSVACLPIRSPSGPIGVLYLEHRARRGRFAEEDLDLLFAFADQAAIAMENARLLAENERRTRELTAANEQLERARAELERVLSARTAELEETREELVRARDALRQSHDRHGMVGRSAAMRAVFQLIERVAPSHVPVVIHGESGTGKEMVARALHYASPRARKPFVAVNCAAIPETLLESELFGHVRGAFTGADRDKRGLVARADGGTLFLDEIGDMPPKMQVDLLRVLQEGTVRPVGGDRDERVDVRVVAASHRRLADEVARGRFREDLYYRLHVVEIRLPPLRERLEDLPLLVEHLLARIAEREGGPRRRLSADAMRRLMSHSWPGNVRELEHVLHGAWVLSSGPVIEAEDLRFGATRPATGEAAALKRDSGDGSALPQSLSDFKAEERRRILAALAAEGWNRVRAARALGMPRRTFYRRLREYGILGQDEHESAGD